MRIGCKIYLGIFHHFATVFPTFTAKRRRGGGCTKSPCKSVALCFAIFCLHFACFRKISMGACQILKTNRPITQQPSSTVCGRRLRWCLINLRHFVTATRAHEYKKPAFYNTGVTVDMDVGVVFCKRKLGLFFSNGYWGCFFANMV